MKFDRFKDLEWTIDNSPCLPVLNGPTLHDFPRQFEDCQRRRRQMDVDSWLEDPHKRYPNLMQIPGPLVRIVGDC